MQDYKWHSITELPDHDGWIWITSGIRNEGFKVRSYYYKKEGEHKHGFEQLRNAKIDINNARYWMWAIPIKEETKN
ncbi:MAG: hypothetical protein [Wendovervirus sonii]|uniref:Uncharacterized protein n=1 Tax=phage Lak_Megaphage_Sonny TaxID=3109229 RepID=A0ABZ0Z4N7_9CAUD|nr:MAG: hypothetical protein [phage Lak_Megaphage_Sonny]